MTPTKEQVIAAFAAEFEPMGYEMELAKCQCCTFASESTQDAFMGFTAGRDQGLREAAQECKRIAIEDYGMVNSLHEYGECAAAIEQLRGE